MRAKRLCRGAVFLALLVLAAPIAPALAAPAGSTLLVSRPDGLGPVPSAFDNRSDTPGALSSDGRYAVFTSEADGFAAGIDPAVQSVLLRDTLAGTTTLVSRSDGPLGAAASHDAENPVVAVAPAGAMPDAPLGQPHVLVAFETPAPNLVDHATGLLVSTVPFYDRVWLRDVTAGTTYLVSKADGAAGAPSDNSATDPAIDVGPAGPVVAFRSIAPNLGAGNGGIFLRTLNAADTQLISCRSNNCGGTPSGSGTAFNPDVRVVAPSAGTLCTSVAHPTGCVFVAFDTTDMSITNDPAGRSQIAVALADAGTTNTGVPSSLFLMSRPNSSGTLLGDGDSTQPSFNGDGRAIAFLSTSANLTADTLPANPRQAYMRSLTGSATRLLSRADGAGAAADGQVHSVSLGGDAAQPRAAFATTSGNLGVPFSTNVYVRNDGTQRTELLNRAAGAAGAPGDSSSGAPPAMSADGSSALFASSAHNLGDPAPYNRVRVRRLATGALQLVSRPDGTAPFESLMGDSHLGQGAVSDDGRYVTFSSFSKALSPLADGTGVQIYVRDVLTGRTILASRADGPSGAIADAGAGAQSATISGDGRFVAFSSSAGNLAAGAPAGIGQVYVRDLVAQTTTLVSRANGPTGSPAPRFAGGATISRDGDVVVFVTSSALDPAGADGNQHVYVRNLGAQTTTLVDRDDGAAGAVATRGGFEAVLDADGSRVAWTTEAALAGAPADSNLHVLRRDLATARTVLVSRVDGPGGTSADFDSRSPSIDADGDVIAFNSRAANLGGAPNGQIYVREVAAGRTQLVSRADGAGGAVPGGGTEFAAIDAAGQRVAFSANGDFAGLPPGTSFQIFVRDLPSQTTTLASRADGPAGAPADGRTDFLAISADGNCVAFSSPSSNLNDGFASFDFDGIHLRVLRGECAPAPPAVVVPPGGQATTAPPRLSRLAVRPRRFHVGGRRGGTTISFTLDKAARVTLAFDRQRAGRRANGRCRARARRGRRCTIATRVGSFAVNARAGRNAIRFSGRLGRRALARGRYLLTATPAGGRAATARVTVVAAPRARRAPRPRRR